MSEPLVEGLSRFTPDGTGLDRDALLFAAGRASVRSGRPWMALAGVLAVSQLLTLVLLWPRPAPPSAAPLPEPAPPVIIEVPVSPPTGDTPELWSLGRRVLESEGDLPPSVVAGPMVPAEAPLRASASASSVILE